MEVLNSAGKYMFCHSPDSWREVWDGPVFKKDSIRVECVLVKIARKDLPAKEGAEFFVLAWSVTRL